MDPLAPPGFFPYESVETPAYSSDSHGPFEGGLLCSPDLSTVRRSNSRSGYRLFARVVDGSGGGCRVPSREVVCAYFSVFGQIIDCYLPESATNVAFVCFEDSSALDACLAAGSEHLLDQSVTVHVSRASPRPDYTTDTDRVFVKGLSLTVHRNDLKLFFSQYGEVTDVYVPKDKTTGTQKRFAFVTFKEVYMARQALECAHLARLPVDGSLIQVMPAEARPLQPPASPEESIVQALLDVLTQISD